jgi:hypothetical protein
MLRACRRAFALQQLSLANGGTGLSMSVDDHPASSITDVH